MPDQLVLFQSPGSSLWHIVKGDVKENLKFNCGIGAVYLGKRSGIVLRPISCPASMDICIECMNSAGFDPRRQSNG